MDLLDRLLGHDAWATRQLLNIAVELPDEQLDFDCGLGLQTVRRTFEHVIGNLECWTDLMRGQPVRARPQSPCSVSLLIQRHEAVTAELMNFARTVVDANRLDDSFIDTLDDPPVRKSLGGGIVHLATHGMHHRAQLYFMFRTLGVTDLPEGDALTWEQQRLRPSA
ncbi:DinB family protein [Rubinisphaera brasiliensis]|uniref:DinB family protein n=1 Tax=Rubinisphaera brasiliensis (strain ATCC 49424 / DSM 5305 / JCM 21570 / IAM 15109 / NBRC 103401 / IFAM 1448) TaxID=756272 RepID=F0SJY4_RUBBR|nr:DinB family protein [Rubinisphaera brasiliensis]ADY58673.1 DinB family protein [Rubinisphaera brasiliensis DSM 5305]